MQVWNADGAGIMRTTREGVCGRRGIHHGLMAGVAAAALLAGLVSAQAQASKPAGTSNTPSAGEGSATTLDEISVEGQNPTFGTKGFVATRSTAGMKGNDSILETPATVSVITREELDVRGVQDINLAVAYTPNVTAIDYPGGQGGPTFTLRGFRAINFENVYEDGLRFGFNSFDQNIEPYAYERIDVIKGPVSVLYGQGQPGGIINLVSKRPTFTPINEVFIQGGNFNRIQAGFDLSGPVEDAPQFAYRLTGLIRKADTQVAFSPDDRVFLAPAITWRPDSDTALTVLAKYAEYRRGGSEQSLPYIGSVVAGPQGFFKRDVFVGQPNFNTELLENMEVGYILDHTFAPGWLFHSAFRAVDTSSKYDVVGYNDFGRDQSSPILNVIPYLRDQSSTSLLADNHVEGQFDTFGIQHNVVAGIDFQSYFRRDRRTFATTSTAIDLFNPIYNYNIVFPQRTDRLTRYSQQQTGIYVQDQMKWNGFILTGSVRNDWSDLRVVNAAPRFNVVLPPSEQQISALSYRAALGYEFAFGVVPYVSYSTSFNPQIAGTRRDGTPLEPTEAKQIEGGVKYQPPGINALFTASYFEITQTNVPAADPGAIGFFIQTGEAVSKGFELEGKTPLADGLNLIFGFAHIDARFTKESADAANLGISLLGKRLANVPENAVSLFLDYSFPPNSIFDGLRAGAGVRYIGARTNITNVDLLPSYALVDASLSYDLSRLDPSWKGVIASVNASNLFDQRYFTAGFYQGTVFEGFRRSVFGTLTYRW